MPRRPSLFFLIALTPRSIEIASPEIPVWALQGQPHLILFGPDSCGISQFDRAIDAHHAQIRAMFPIDRPGRCRHHAAPFFFSCSIVFGLQPVQKCHRDTEVQISDGLVRGKGNRSQSFCSQPCQLRRQMAALQGAENRRSASGYSQPPDPTEVTRWSMMGRLLQHESIR